MIKVSDYVLKFARWKFLYNKKFFFFGYSDFTLQNTALINMSRIIVNY